MQLMGGRVSANKSKKIQYRFRLVEPILHYTTRRQFSFLTSIIYIIYILNQLMKFSLKRSMGTFQSLRPTL